MGSCSKESANSSKRSKFLGKLIPAYCKWKWREKELNTEKPRCRCRRIIMRQEQCIKFLRGRDVSTASARYEKPHAPLHRKEDRDGILSDLGTSALSYW